MFNLFESLSMSLEESTGCVNIITVKYILNKEIW